MWRFERRSGHERVDSLKVGKRRNARDLESFPLREVGKDAHESLGQHCFSGAGRTEHERVMAASCCNDERLDDVGLPNHIGEVPVVDDRRTRVRGQNRVSFRRIDVSPVNCRGVAKARHCKHANPRNEFGF